MGKQPILLRDFLAEMGRAVAYTQIANVRQYVETLLARDALDVGIPLGDDEIAIDGVSLLPEGMPQLEELTIRCETEVSCLPDLKKDDEAVVPDIKMSMTKGLFGRGMHVQIEAKYSRGNPIESIEILRERANVKIQEAILEINHSTKEPADG